MTQIYDENILKTSNEWYEEIHKKDGLVICDPDGWDRTNYQYSFFEEKITVKVYFDRLFRSTIVYDKELIPDVQILKRVSSTLSFSTDLELKEALFNAFNKSFGFNGSHPEVGELYNYCVENEKTHIYQEAYEEYYK